jgi:hypothetical protein
MSRLWCANLDRQALASPERFQKLISAGVRGFTAACELDAKRVLSLLDAWRPYDDYIVAYEPLTDGLLLHPNAAHLFSGAPTELQYLKAAVMHGRNAVVHVCNIDQILEAYEAGLKERDRHGLPLFTTRLVLEFDRSDWRSVSKFENYLQTSQLLKRLRPRGLHPPELLRNVTAVALSRAS